MTIEEEIFKKSKVDFSKIIKYGFKKDKKIYRYSKKIMNEAFEINVEIDEIGNVKGKVIDLSFEDEYTNFRVEGPRGAFAGEVREEFENLLKDIKSKCFRKENFIFEQSNRITNLIKEKYGDEPEFKWENDSGTATFSNKISKKWYGIIMTINKIKLNEKSDEIVEVMNVKLEPDKIQKLIQINGFYPAYHMNKKSWITIILDNTNSDEKIMELIEESYSYTITKKDNSNEWLIPANPKYFDVEKALEKNDTIIWKQSTDIKIGDIVYLYEGKPYSCIMHKFKVIEVNIPYEEKNENLEIKKVMRINLLKSYEKGKYSFDKLKEFGVNSVRGPRYMPLSLSKYINKK